MWTLGWGPDYGDENNWVGDVMYCENAPRMRRTCNEIDEMIVEAREESDPARARRGADRRRSPWDLRDPGVV